MPVLHAMHCRAGVWKEGICEQSVGLWSETHTYFKRTMTIPETAQKHSIADADADAVESPISLDPQQM